MTKVVQFSVEMKCQGCAGAVKKILSRIEGVSEIDANLETKKVLVSCEDEVEDQALLEALLKWSVSSGKAVALVA